MSSVMQGTPFGRYARYMKYVPFFSLPIVAFFPSGLNLYWCTLAFVHLNMTLFIKSDFAKRIFGIPKYLPGSILEKMN